MKIWKRLAVGSILAFGIAGSSSVAEAVPAGAGTIGIERSAPGSAVEQVHYRHYRHCHRHRGHVHCHGGHHHPYRSAGIYLNFGPYWGWGHRHHHHRHHYRHHHRHHRHW